MEDRIKKVIHLYEYVPHQVLIKLFCHSKNERKYLERSLKRLTLERYITHDKQNDTYSIPLPCRKIDDNLIRALWVLTEFDKVSYHTPSTSDFIKIAFLTDDGNIYEIIILAANSYKVIVPSVNYGTQKSNRPQRIVIVKDEKEANKISDDILKELNCIAFCSVSLEGEITSYDFGD